MPSKKNFSGDSSSAIRNIILCLATTAFLAAPARAADKKSTEDETIDAEKNMTGGPAAAVEILNALKSRRHKNQNAMVFRPLSFQDAAATFDLWAERGIATKKKVAGKWERVGWAEESRSYYDPKGAGGHLVFGTDANPFANDHSPSSFLVTGTDMPKDDAADHQADLSSGIVSFHVDLPGEETTTLQIPQCLHMTQGIRFPYCDLVNYTTQVRKDPITLHFEYSCVLIKDGSHMLCRISGTADHYDFTSREVTVSQIPTKNSYQFLIKQ